MTLRKNDCFSKRATFQNIIEAQVKLVYAYEFTKVYGATGYLKCAHFVNDLKADIPLWAFVDLLTISDISFLYSISEEPIREEVAKEFNLAMSRGAKILGGYMHSMTIIRKLCAHGSGIYNRLFVQKPSLNKIEQELLIKKPDGNIDNSHFYGFVLVMKRLLSVNIFNEIKSELIILIKKYPFVRMDYYGFRNDWIDKL